MPATKRCGILAKSTTTGLPKISLPRVSGNLNFVSLYVSSLSNSLKKTVSLFLFGISIPKASLPGIVEILADFALIDLAISSESLITVEDCVPGAGVSSKRVTIGPCFTSVILPFILKSSNTFPSIIVFTSVFFLFSISIEGFFFGFSKSSKEGKIKLELVTNGLMCFLVDLDFFIVFLEISFSKILFKLSSLENLSP